MKPYRPKPDIEETRYVVDVPISFIEYCLRKAKEPWRKKELRKLLRTAKKSRGC